MNWTGGAKQRYATGTGSLRHRHQQHFAKVNAGILAGKKHSPRKHPNLDRLRQLHQGSTQARQPSVTIVAPQTHNDRPSSQRHANSFPTNAPHESRLFHSPAIQRHPTTAIKRERLSKNGFHISAPPPRGEKRDYQHDSVTPGSIDREVESPLFEKRRKILLKGDWVGVGFQHPPQVAKVSSQNKQEVGRRRKVRDGHRPQYSNKQQSYRPTKVNRQRQPSPREYHEHAPGNSGQIGVKIAIGGKVKAPGMSSSSAPKRTGSQSSHRGISNRPPSHSSEIMLLDNERLQSGSMSSKGLSSLRLANENSATSEHHRQPLFCHSSASLVQPIPRNSKVARILRSLSVDVEVAGSTIAQVGRSKPVVPSSEAFDNGTWETWMQVLIPEYDTSTESTAQQDVHISPGVSAVPTCGPTYNTTDISAVDYLDETSAGVTSFGLRDLPMDLGHHDEKILPNEYSIIGQSEETGYFGEMVETNAGRDISDDYSIGGEYVEEEHAVPGLITQSLPGSSPIGRRKFKLPSPLPELPTDEGDAFSFVSSSPPGKSSTKSPISNQQQIFRVNQNETHNSTNFATKRVELPVIVEEGGSDHMWKQFVFGSDGEDVEIFGQESALSVSTLGQPHESSVVVQQSLSNFVTSVASPGGKNDNTSRFFPTEQPTASLLEYRMADDESIYLGQDENTYTLDAWTGRATRDGSSSWTESEELSQPRRAVSIITQPRISTVTNPVQRLKNKGMFTQPTPFISSHVESSSEREEIVHISKKNNDKKTTVKSNGAVKKGRDKDIYSLPSLSSDTDVLEYIEDD